MNLPNIDFKKSKRNPTVDAETSMFELPFYKDIDYFANLDNFVNFVKSVERQVRTSRHYSRYIAYLKEEMGLTYCQVLSNIEDEYASIEMHHGPIFSLFDYAAIITDHMLANNEKITSFAVADRLLEEHYKNNIQVVMLSKTVHEQVHENTVFINLKQGFGDIEAFFKKYRKGIQPEQVVKINQYIRKCEEHDSGDNGALDLRDKLKKWAYQEVEL